MPIIILINVLINQFDLIKRSRFRMCDFISQEQREGNMRNSINWECRHEKEEIFDSVPYWTDSSAKWPVSLITIWNIRFSIIFYSYEEEVKAPIFVYNRYSSDPTERSHQQRVILYHRKNDLTNAINFNKVLESYRFNQGIVVKNPLKIELVSSKGNIYRRPSKER